MSDLNVVILVPSRGRPHNMARLSKAVQDTAPDVTILCRLDDDDISLHSYPNLTNVTYTVGPRIGFAASVNELAEQANDYGAHYLAILGDDVVPETPGWDLTLIAALNGRLGVAYGSDGLEHLHGHDLPTHVLIPTEMYRRLGWVALPELAHLFCDNVWRELGRGLGCFEYRPDVKLTHLHRWNKAAPDDQTYREANDKHRRARDKAAFEFWRDGDGYREAIRALIR